jgi:hypothetical protein
MTIKRRLPQPKKVKLPPAHLYLDDVDEIIGILRPEGEDGPPVLQFTVDDQYCDSVDELRKIGEGRIGGRTNRFEMNVPWKTKYLHDALEIEPGLRAELSVGGSVQRQVWAMNQVQGVFIRRTHPRWKYRWLAVLGFVVVFFGGFHLLFTSLDQLPLFRAKPWYFLVVDVGYAMFMGAFSFPWLGRKFFQSKVSLRNYQGRESFLGLYRDQIVVAAVTALITNPIAVLIAILLQRWLTHK